MAKPPFAELDFAPPRVAVERGAGGQIILRSPQQLAPYARASGEWLQHWAREAPQRPFLAERSGSGWRCVSYAEAHDQARRIAAALLRRGLGPQRPVAVLSDNGVEHALLMLGALHAGVPLAPISPAYSLMSQDHAKLKAIIGLLQPGLVYVADGARYAAALGALPLAGAEVVVGGHPLADIRCTPYAELLAEQNDAAVDAAFRAITPDTIAKFLFTSGSTGEPKGVINTQRMLCSNQQAIAQLWHFLAETPPVVVDWLPWSHTFGANHNFNLVLRNGGTLYIDGGKPAPGLIETSVANLREIAPTVYFNVPRGFDMLLPHLEQDAQLRKNFFSRLQLIFYAAAALPQSLWERLERLSIAERGERVLLVSAWGATETAPLITSVHFPIEYAGIIGLPAPGSELKLQPHAGKLEARVRGPGVFPGYWQRPDLSAAALDAEGWYMTGDAVRFADPDDPTQGLVFDGRIAEDFKLASGTWVHVGALRIQGISALAPLAQDIVVAGHDRDEVGFLVFVNGPACRQLCPELAADAPLAQVLRDGRVRDRVREGMARLAGAGSSGRAARALLLAEPASIDAGEITDKGYINQGAVLRGREPLVAQLYSDSPEVIRLQS